MRKLAIASFAALSVSGCATIFEGGTQPVTFKSMPDGATLVVENRAGQKIHAGITPATVTLKRGAGYFKSESYAVTVSKPGFQTKTINVTGSVNGWYVANIIFGGLIGLLIIDPATGAMYNLAPDVVEATLDAGGVSMNEGEHVLTIMLAEDVPLALWQHARRIETN